MTSAAAVGDYSRRLCAWVDQNLDRFTPWHADGETTPSSIQRFAELSIAYDVLTRSPLGLPSPEGRWHPFIREHLGRPALAELARTHLDLAWALLLPYLVLRGRGDVSRYHDETLAAAQQAGFPQALEVVAYRALDYAYFGQVAGLATSTDDRITNLLGGTFAARASCAYVVNDDSAYALTHAIFYVSGFGQKRVEHALSTHAAAIIDSMIVDCAIRRHYDLLGELLIASLVVSGTRPELRNLALPVFFSTLDESGSLMPNDHESNRGFDACYHTTMVGLILCASLATTTSA